METHILHRRGYRLTPQRYLILRVLEQAQEHLSAAQILQRVHQENPYLTLPTVYRTLELLKDLGVVLENHFSPEQATYEARQGATHQHLFCRRCQAVLHLKTLPIAPLPEEIEQTQHFHDVVVTVAAVGYCDACWQTMQKGAS
jgi:Fe2+ or Zn2+ uptake regulation protein